MTVTWLTVDCDDIRHIPKHQGHPTRSKTPIASNDLSAKFRAGLSGFQTWLASHDKPVTLFVIADLLENREFCDWLNDMMMHNQSRITIGCHGLNHKSWSAWPEDSSLFRESITQATSTIAKFAKTLYRPWFRAPAGYMAPWMVKPLVQCGITVDSSINDSLLTRTKSGRGNSWQQVREVCDQENLIQREWLTKWNMPINGPALSMFPLSILAKRAWKKLPEVIQAEQLTQIIEDKHAPVTTVYWHILDHARQRGSWRPPIPDSILNH